MSNTKQKILSELKSKLTQFKSKLKSHKTIDEQKVDDELILKISPNKSKDTNINKENIDNNREAILEAYSKPVSSSSRLPVPTKKQKKLLYFYILNKRKYYFNNIIQMSKEI